MPITPQDYNGDAILGEQLSKLMEKEIRDRLKGDVPEILAHALCVMAAEIDALKAALAASNLGERVADSLDAQTLNVGGKGVQPKLPSCGGNGQPIWLKNEGGEAVPAEIPVQSKTLPTGGTQNFLTLDVNSAFYSHSAGKSELVNVGNAVTPAIAGKEDGGAKFSRVYNLSDSALNGYPCQYGNLLTVGGGGGGQLLLGWSKDDQGIEKIYYRNRRDTALTDGQCWSEWRAIAFDVDKQDKLPTSGNATESYAINISGKASYLNAACGTSIQPVYFAQDGNNNRAVATVIPTETETLPDQTTGTFLTLQAHGAYYSHYAGIANSANSINGYTIAVGAYGGSANTIYLY